LHVTKEAAKSVVARRREETPGKRTPEDLQTDVRLKPDLNRKKLAFTLLLPYDGKLAFF
jgi:hypothetical protein